MSSKRRDKPDKLIINSPFTEPAQHWDTDKTTGKFYIKDGRRDAGYVIASQSKKYSEQGHFVEIPLVNKIRPRVKKWRDGGYQGVNGITKRLLTFWREKGADGRAFEFFFCQLEAIETLIWLKEAHASEKTGIAIAGDGGAFERLCCKMATGTGKTYVMAMTIAWHILNKVTYPQDARFSKNIFIVAPNLTVKSRLAVLYFNNANNYYQENKIVPADLLDKMRQGKVLIENWHTLMWETEEQIAKRKSIDKRGAKSDAAWTNDVLQDMAKAKNLLIINDEAHHAWRSRQDVKHKGIDKKEIEMATCWIKGLDRLHKTRNILSCYDFSATPFSPSGTKGKTAYEEDLFRWIVSDFGLLDAIESGLTKTPRFVVRDNGKIDPKSYKTKLYHIYNDEKVKESLNRRAKAEEPLPELVKHAYIFLGYDWQETYKGWAKHRMQTPPVMITTANRKETADRVKHMFNSKTLDLEELCDEENTVLIYSDLESGKQEELREKVNTVGQLGKTGEQVKHVISVAMLTEGWDCKTVTHIMGLRAFSSQLLCEQIVGRGLRRTAYELNEDGLFDAEYVNIFGIPFAFIPHEDTGDGNPKPPSPRHPIEPMLERIKYKITWPNVERIDINLRPKLSVDFRQVKQLEIANITTIVELAPEVNGQPDYDKIKTIDLEKLIQEDRRQTVIFETAKAVYAQADYEWKKKINQAYAIKQLLRIVESFLDSGKLKIYPQSFQDDPKRKNVAIMLGMEQIVKKILFEITHQNSEELSVRYKNPKYRSTNNAIKWSTAKKVKPHKKTHMNLCAFDSAWEATHARELDRCKHVEAWVKNDHLGFEIPYIHSGGLRSYIPDFIVKLTNGSHLILEVKGQQKGKDTSKWQAVENWTKAVSQDEENGQWNFAVSEDPTGQKVHVIIDQLMRKKNA
ncbi:MAG: DEAD/DEAH box helicase family protein [Pseudomonadota bacterium]|nr:DEAD/DEAH box helicase family protein [Pseudomonadota bacterium]